MSIVKKVWNNFEEIITVTFFIVMCLAVTLGVVARLLHLQVIWTNDVARYSFMWITFMGASAGIKRKKHIVVDVLMNIFPPAVKRICSIAVSLISIALFVLLAYYGLNLARSLWYTEISTMPVSIGWVYLSLPVSAICMTIRTIEGIVKDYMAGRRKEAA